MGGVHRTCCRQGNTREGCGLLACRGWLGLTAQPERRRKCKGISVDLGEDVGRKELALCWGRAETEQRQDPGGAASEACHNLSSHLPKCVPNFICKTGLGGRLRPSPSRTQRYPPSELGGCLWEGELREALVGGVRAAGGAGRRLLWVWLVQLKGCQGHSL